MVEFDFGRQVGAAGRILLLSWLAGRACIPGWIKGRQSLGRIATDWYCDAAIEVRLAAERDGFGNPWFPPR